jgi:NAD(P)H-nitrite reductase large subunit
MNDDDLIICRCEEITKKEIVEAIRRGKCTSADEVKRLTRAGMGPCQGRTCEKAVARIIQQMTGIPLSQQKPLSVQFPLRPIKLGTIISSMDNEEIKELEHQRSQSRGPRH